MKIDYLIVGQGIAGTLLAYFLQKRQREVIIINQYNPSSASLVGAGLFNPITGQRHVKTWMADVLFPFAEKTYKDLEKYLNLSFYHKINLIKIFDSEEVHNKWIDKISSGELTTYVAGNDFSGINLKSVAKNTYSAELKGTGFVEMVNLITAFKDKLTDEKRYIEAKLYFEDLKFNEDTVKWNHIQAEKIIFCDGYMAKQNPLFSWLPFVLTKGDVLTIEAEELNLDKILNKDIFVLPLGKGKYRTGSTYIWEYHSEDPEFSGKEEIVRKLAELITCPFSIYDHKAGIRPTVKDRKPIIGLHPIKNNVGVFNGLGTKGITFAPYFANHFVEFLEDNISLNRSVDIQRFYKYFDKPIH